MVDDRVPADARYSDADDRAAAAMVYDETAVHRLARELDHRHIDRGARVQFRNADGRSRTAGGRYGLVDPAHVQYDSRRLSAGEARGCDGLCRSRHYVRAGDRPDRGGSPDRIFNMALHLLALAAVFGHRAVDRAEVFGKRHRRYEAPHRSAVRHIVHDRLWRRRLRLQQGGRRRRRLDQRDRGHIDRYRAGSARAVHVAADVYARADDEPARLQVPDVLSGAAYGAVVYDDYFVEHDYSADVSAERHETFRVRRRAHAAAGQRAERHPVAAHGAFVRQIWAEVARHSRPRRRCSDVMVFLRHYAGVFGRFHCRLAYRPNGRHLHGVDAGADERPEPAATGAVSAWHGGHEHAAAGRRRDRHGDRDQYPYERHGELFARLPRADRADRDGQRDDVRLPERVLVRDDCDADRFGHGVLHPPRRRQPCVDESDALMLRKGTPAKIRYS